MAADGQKQDELDELERRFHAGETRPGAGSGVAQDPPPAGRADQALAARDEHAALRTSHLARRLAKRRGYALAAPEPKSRRLLSSWGLGGVALLAAWSLWGAWPGLAYWLSRAPAVDLGHLGRYDLSAARDGAFARVEGVASPKRGTYSRFFGQHELFPLIASRVLVDRAGAPDESLRGFAFKYRGEGRLHRVEPGGKWEAVREQFTGAGELAREGDVWLLEDGVAPGRGWAAPSEAGAWLLVCAACLGLLARRLRERLRPAAGAL